MIMAIETELTRHQQRLDQVALTAQRVTPPQNRMFEAHGQGDNVFLQVLGWVRDLTDPTGEDSRHSWQYGPRQWVSPSATTNDIFRMMLSMLIAFDEHETREAFLVDGVRVFGPHIKVDALKSVASHVDF